MSENIDPADVKHTPLENEHKRAGAFMAVFGGWYMPIRYTGIVQEHVHSRTRVGIFDICHMGEFKVEGDKACDDLNRIVTCDVATLAVGKCRYGFLLNDNAGIMDDLLVYRIAKDKFMLVVNAASTKSDSLWISSKLSRGTFFEDISPKTAKLDIQGPLCDEVFKDVFGVSTSGISYYSFISSRLAGLDMILSRTGYTGELGYEIYFDINQAVKIWNMVLSHPLVKPAGLGARDTLRLEMGYRLCGSDMTSNQSPFEAGLGKFVCMTKDFIGKKVLLEKLSNEEYSVLSGFVVSGQRSARHGFDVYKNDQRIGYVTSASLSPSLKYNIGLAYVKNKYAAIGEKITIKSDRLSLDAEIVDIPFYKDGTVKRQKGVLNG